MVCSVCGSNTKMMSGISKKNGTPWTGFKCLAQECGNMDFQNPNQNISPQIKKQTPTNEPEILRLLLDIIRRQDEIKAMLTDIHPATKALKQPINKPLGEEQF